MPLHLLFGRRIAFPTFVWLARHAPWTLREPANENSFIKLAQQDRLKDDDLLELVRVQRLRRQIADAGLEVVVEHLHVTRTFRRLPGPIPRWLRDSPLTQLLLLVVATALHQVWASAFDASGGLTAVGWLAGRVLPATITTAPLGVVVLLLSQLFTRRRGYGNASGSSAA